MRLFLWILIAWPLPALVAGALGWSSIWGSGSALGDYLIPIPVAGGALHVPSFVLCGLVVWNMPSRSARAAGRLRALLIGAALAGLLWLLKLDDILLALQTNSTLSGSPWQQNPLGLFVLSDALIALLFTAGASAGPWLRLELASALLVLLPAVLPLGMAFKFSRAGEPFMLGDSRQGKERGDEIVMAFTSLDVNAPDFRTRAEAWSAFQHPRLSINSDDVAILFTRNLDAARRFETSKAVMTLCLFEDGTPPQWMPGSGADECFDNHVSFSEKFARSYAARPAGEALDLKDYMARKAVCVGVATIPPSGDTGGIELSGMRICSRLPEAREKLLLKYPEAAAGLDAPP